MAGTTTLGLVLFLCSSLAQGSNDIDPLQPVVENLSVQVNELKAQLYALRNDVNDVRDLAQRQVVAFSAYISSEPMVSASQGSIVPFHGVLTNVGDSYDPNTSVFTAPVGGTYLFILHADCSHDYRAVEVRVNGKLAFTADNDGKDAHVTGSGIVHLRKGDTVFATHYEGKGYLDAGIESTFSGFLIK